MGCGALICRFSARICICRFQLETRPRDLHEQHAVCLVKLQPTESVVPMYTNKPLAPHIRVF